MGADYDARLRRGEADRVAKLVELLGDLTRSEVDTFASASDRDSITADLERLGLGPDPEDWY